jgi:hypothetical protein
MKKSSFVAMLAGLFTAGTLSTANAIPCDPVLPVPGCTPTSGGTVLTADETNIAVLIDVTYSMTTNLTTDTNRMKKALQLAREYVQKHASDTNVEFTLYSFKADYGVAANYVQQHLPWGSTAAQVLEWLAWDDANNQPVKTELLPNGYATPLAGAGCFLAREVLGDLNLSQTDAAASGVLGHDWGKTIAVGGKTKKSTISRHVYISTDGYENDTPDAADDDEIQCGGPSAPAGTSFDSFPAQTWQWRLKNKLMTGNPLHVWSSTLPPMVVDIDLTYNNMSSFGSEEAGQYASNVPYAESTFFAAREFYRGISLKTGGAYRETRVSKAGTVETNFPGDATRDGCVGMPDYSMLVSVYGNSIWQRQSDGREILDDVALKCDFNDDGWVDYLDYVMLVDNWGRGTAPQCPADG